MNKIEALPEPVGIKTPLHIDGKVRTVDIFTMREGNNEVKYAFFKKPHTDFGISASVRRLG